MTKITQNPGPETQKWYRSTGFIILSSILFFPLGLTLLWTDRSTTGILASKRSKIILTGLVLALAMFGFSGKGDKKGGSGLADVENIAAPEPKIGERYRTEKYEITVTSARARRSVGTYASEKPAEGAIFIEVLYKYKNATKEPIDFGFPDVRLVDPNGNEYDAQISATLQLALESSFSKKTLSELNPGVTDSNGQIFEVSTDLWKMPGWKIAVKADEDYTVSIK